MNVVHLSATDLSGGAGRAAWRLHRGLLAAGVDSTMIVSEKSSLTGSVEVFRPPMDLPNRTFRRLRRFVTARQLAPYRTTRPVGGEVFTGPWSEHGDGVLRQIGRTDVVNLHWVSGMFDYDSFFRRLPGEIPVVWTLHDFNPFTGGCHYPGDCDRYRARCGRCPVLGSTRETDLSTRFQQLKRRALEKSGQPLRLQLIAPSRWLAGEAAASSVFGGAAVAAVPNGLDTDVFRPRDRALCRAMWEIPEESEVVLFVSDHLGQRRKGIELIVEALSRVGGRRDLLAISVGGGDISLAGAGVKNRHLGRVDQEILLAKVYAAADLFVLPSRQDNLPNTAAEAMACGIPVVGFNVGGVPELVEDGVTGALVEPFDTAALGDRVGELLGDGARRDEMGSAAAQRARERFSSGVQAAAYREIYEALLC